MPSSLKIRRPAPPPARSDPEARRRPLLLPPTPPLPAVAPSPPTPAAAPPPLPAPDAPVVCWFLFNHSVAAVPVGASSVAAVPVGARCDDFSTDPLLLYPRREEHWLASLLSSLRPPLLIKSHKYGAGLILRSEDFAASLLSLFQELGDE